MLLFGAPTGFPVTRTLLLTPAPDTNTIHPQSARLTGAPSRYGLYSETLALRGYTSTVSSRTWTRYGFEVMAQPRLGRIVELRLRGGDGIEWWDHF
ncbi:hypothetical protein ACJ72_07805 [Emergomyces africanus]|uniref:Uncharacterized protein n=1 Tax=Emergomyces africanus TaxID=1955775 RepID=A0A1B7NMR9_9EURO|nr:hypothetical protein ACJ72_07805 [Emergomyces africanus]